MSHAATLTINLRNLALNYRDCKLRSVQATCGAAIKADCYGLGMAQILPLLWDEGCRHFFVAHEEEGERALAILPNATIYVLHGETTNEKLITVVNSFEQPLPNRDFAVMVETGMNRLGVTIEQARVILQNQNAKLMMSHFSCSDNASHPQNALQISRFNALRAQFPHIKASLANSDGLQFSESHHDLTRAGIGIYDGLHNIVTLKAPILQVKPLMKGESVGYGANYQANTNTRIAIVSLGYADGFLRAGQGGYASLNHHKCEIIGRISMDLIALDIGGLCAKAGDLVEFFGDNHRLNEVAKAANTISYELLTRLSPRLKRVYVS